MSELDFEWRRKTSFESRAFAIFTLNLAVATLFLVLQSQLRFVLPAPGTLLNGVLVLSLACVAASTVVAVAAVIPWGHTSLKGEELGNMADSVAQSDDDYEWLIMRAQAEILRRAFNANLAKGIILIVAFILVGVEVIGLTVVLTNIPVATP